MELRLGTEAAPKTLEHSYACKAGLPAPSGEPVAIIVTHGMGQQVPYETIEDVVQAVWRGIGQPANHVTSPGSLIRRVRLGIEGKGDVETELVRAEVQVEREGKVFDVHIYEAYWAPLTEGKVTLRDVMTFLFKAGWNGFWNTAVKDGYRRWMFRNEKTFKLRKLSFRLPKLRLMLTLSLLMLLLLSLVFMNALLMATATSHSIGGSGAFPAGCLVSPLTADFIVVDIALLLIGLVTIWPRRFPSRIGWSLIGFAAVIILLAGFAVAAQLMGLKPEELLWPWAVGWADYLGTVPRVGTLILTALWGIELAAAFGIRWCLIEYVGDVTAYIAFHTVSKFYDVRQQIWQTAMKVARSVYRAEARPEGESTEPDFLYKKIIVVGHSLGSVISYDVLNGLLLEEATSKEALKIAPRTRMFLTFGSPLDKTDFLFRTQADIQSVVREVAAAAVQPMIQDYSYRPREWVNLYSKSDIISGALDYYDPPTDKNVHDKEKFGEEGGHTINPRAVQNLPDPSAQTPLTAHVEYWTGDLFARELVRAITT